MTNPLIPCTVQLLCRNSAATIGECLESLSDFAEIIVQDGYSTDATREIASRFPNARIINQNRDYIDTTGRIVNFAAMRNESITAASNDWIFVVDADERTQPNLVSEVRAIVAAGSPGVYQAFRRFFVNGVPIAAASAYPTVQIRLFHRSLTAGYEKSVHERLKLHPGVTPLMLQEELPVPLPPPGALLKKYQRYLDLERKRVGLMPWGRWARWVLWRNCKTAAGLTARTLWIRLTPQAGKRLPIAYEAQFVIHSLLTIAWTCPLTVWWMRLPLTFRQAVAYFLAGSTAAAIDLGLFYLLLTAGMWYLGASVMSGIAAFLTAFVLHRSVVFRSKGPAMIQFARFTLMGIGNIAAATALLYVGVEWAGLPDVIAKPLCTLIIAAANFVGYKKFVYAS